jgi:glycosyltransferase involved in cell wall biosynthesis
LIGFAIVTPSYNQGRFIERTIRSVLEQGYPHVEYVIVDGGSTDCTPGVLERYARRARVIVEPDRGQADAVNKGIRATSAEVIGWLNSDDTYCHGALVTVAACFARRPDVDVLYGDANYIDSDDKVIGKYYTEAWNRRRLLHRPFLSQPAVFFRRRVVDRYGHLDEGLQYTLDYEYWLRLASAGAHFEYLPYTLANTRLHAESKTETHGLRQFVELEHVLKRYAGRIPDEWLLTYTHAILREKHPVPFRGPLEFAVQVVRASAALSLRLNGTISANLVFSSLRTLVAGAGKSAMGRPVRAPTE